MLSVITELRVDEPARFNPEKLEDLCHRIGDAQAETEVALALTGSRRCWMRSHR